MQCSEASHILDLSIILAYKVVASGYTAQKLLLTVTFCDSNKSTNMMQQFHKFIT